MEKEVKSSQRTTDIIPQLSEHVIPLSYFVLIEPDLEAREYTGGLSIDIEVTTTPPWIILNKSNLEISNVRINSLSTSNMIEIESIIDLPEHDMFSISTSDRIDPGKYTILMSFKGILNSDPVGLYLIEAEDPDGNKRTTLLSNFSSNYARQVFPCFDDPSFKAKFHIKFTKPEAHGVIVISNMPMDKKSEDYPSLGLTTVRFFPTPIMSITSLFIVMGKFISLSPSLTDEKVPLYVYSFPEVVEETVYMRNLGASYFNLIQKYFKMNYYIEKLDIIVIPGAPWAQYASPGVIVLNDPKMIFTTETCTTKGVLELATILSHYLTTLWLGNIVTFEEPESVHVIKGCATVVGHLAGHSIFPFWHKEWVILHLHYFPNLRRDSINLYPVAFEEDGCEVEENENLIAHRKSACLMRMVRDFSGLNYRKALGTLLFESRNTHCHLDVLWKHLGSGLNFPSEFSYVMNEWLTQESYPLVSVVILHINRYYIVQEPFVKTDCYKKSLWNIPVKYVTSEAPKEVKFVWSHKEKELVQIDVSPTARWMKLNWHCIGYFRVNYPTKVWRELAFDLANDCTLFDPEDRSGLIDDAFVLAESGRLFYDVPLGIVSYLKFGQEDHFLPFSIASLHLFCLYKRFSQTDMEFIYQRYIELLIKPYITEDLFEFDDTQSFLKKKLKVEVIKMGCWVSHSDVLERISAMFQEWINGEEPPYEIKEIVFKYAFSKNCGPEWEDILNMAKSETDNYKRKLLWAAVSSTKDPSLSLTVLNTLIEEDVPREEMFNVMKMVLNNPQVNSSVWWFISQNWDKVDQKFMDKPHQLAIIVSDATRYFVLPSVLEEVRDFFCSQPSTRIEEEDKCTIMRHIKSNINWHLSHIKLISEWLHFFITSQWPTA